MHLVSVHTDIRRGKLSDETKTRHLTKKWYEQRYAPQLNFLLLDAYSDFLSGQHSCGVEVTLMATRNAFIFWSHAQRTRSI